MKKMNLTRSGDIVPVLRHLIPKARRLGIPTSLVFLITYNCNFRCLHCLNKFLLQTKVKSREVNYREICSTLSQVADLGTILLTISGGEPFIKPDFWKIMEYAKKKEFAISLTTNGSLITKDVARRLSDLVIFGVTMSIYGMSEEVYRHITGTDDVFKKVMDGIGFLIKENIGLTLRMVLMRENFNQLKLFENLTKEVKVEKNFRWDFNFCRGGSSESLKHIISESQIMRFLCSHPEECEPEFVGKLSKPPPSALLCSLAAHHNIAVDPYGNVSPCQLITEKFNFSNIRDKSIVEIWKNDELFLRFRNLHFKDMTQCVNCKFLTHCELCPGKSFLESGMLNLPASESICRLSRIKKKADKKIHST